MRKIYYVISGLVAVALCIYLSSPHSAFSRATPRELPLPPRAAEAQGVNLPNPPWNPSPHENNSQQKIPRGEHANRALSVTLPDGSKGAVASIDAKERLTTHDEIVSKSIIWDVNALAILRDDIGPNDPLDCTHTLWFYINVRNNTELTYENVMISFIFNPQLEYHYLYHQTFTGNWFDSITPEGKPGAKGMGISKPFPLPGNNPFHLREVVLKERLNICFRDLYLVTEWDGGREILLIDPDTVDFRKEFEQNAD